MLGVPGTSSSVGNPRGLAPIHRGRRVVRRVGGVPDGRRLREGGHRQGRGVRRGVDARAVERKALMKMARKASEVRVKICTGVGGVRV